MFVLYCIPVVEKNVITKVITLTFFGYYLPYIIR